MNVKPSKWDNHLNYWVHANIFFCDKQMFTLFNDRELYVAKNYLVGIALMLVLLHVVTVLHSCWSYCMLSPYCTHAGPTACCHHIALMLVLLHVVTILHSCWSYCMLSPYCTHAGPTACCHHIALMLVLLHVVTILHSCWSYCMLSPYCTHAGPTACCHHIAHTAW